MKHYGLIINGDIIYTKKSNDVIDPSTGNVFQHAPITETRHLDLAIKGARHAFLFWRDSSTDKRVKYLHLFADLIEENKYDLAKLLTQEQGKPFHSQATAEIQYAIDWIRGFKPLSCEESIIENTGEQYAIRLRQPIGIVGAIVPWNFPVVLSIWKIVEAVGMGNCIILKPAPTTPLTLLRIGELAQQVFPAGVINILTGDDCLGKELVLHKQIDKISFTGSREAGKDVMRHAADNLRPITLELGGNDAAIVLEDVDISLAVPRIFWGAFGNSGQWCVAIKRLYIHENIFDAFCEKLFDYAHTIKVGPGFNTDTDLGPIQNIKQYQKLSDYLEKCKTDKLTVIQIPMKNILPGVGYFFPITFIVNPSDYSQIVTEEQFGPILPILKYKDVDEVIKRANNTDYGLGASIWGENKKIIKQIVKKLEVGTVWINEVYEHQQNIPFGGIKTSGFGVEHGFEGMLEQINTKVCMNIKK